MLGWLTAHLKRQLETEVPAAGLALFRIGYGSVLLFELLFLIAFRPLIFDPIPFLDPGPPLVGFYLTLWFLAALGLILGLYTRLAALVNYCFWVLFVSFTPLWRDFDGGFDQLMTASGFLLLFLPSARVLSLDRLRLKLKHSFPGRIYEPPRTVTKLAYTVPILFVLVPLYFDSAIHKLFSHHWLSGFGIWVPLTHPYYISPLPLGTWLADQELLIKALGYAIIVFQLTFPFLVWFLQPLYLLFGVSFHLGITLLLNIYPFGVGMLVHYFLLVPARWWTWLGDKIQRERSLRSKTPQLEVFYDAECPLCLRTRLVVEHFDLRQAIRFRPLQTEARKRPELAGISEEELLRDLYAVDGRGKVYCGLDAYLAILKVLGLTPIAWLVEKIPPLYRWAADRYRRIADSRIRLGSANFASKCDERCLPRLEPPQDRLLAWWEQFAGKSTEAQAFRLSRLLLIALLFQFNATLHFGLFLRLGLELPPPLGEISRGLLSFSHVFFGITTHPLYVDDHFRGYRYIFALSYLDREGKERWLPFIDERGMFRFSNYGRVHAMWANMAITPKPRKWVVAKFSQKVTAFYGQKAGLELDDACFFLKAKPIKITARWEEGLQQQNLEGEWFDVAEMRWQEKVFSVRWLREEPFDPGQI